MRSILSIAVVVCCLCSVAAAVVRSGSSDGFGKARDTETAISFLENELIPSSVPMVPLTLIQGADSKGAVCLDGTLPGYHLDRGFGSGANSWLIQLEGGGWCNNHRSCVYRKTSRRGSSNFMEKALAFTGILSNKSEENPDFFNWNRIKLRYCDGASFAGDSQDQDSQLFYRGQRIWQAAMQEFLSLGMQQANQALLSGCSAGGLASILHCDKFRELLPTSTKVKCLSDAGMFLDAVDVSGGHSLRNMFQGVVTVQNLQKDLSSTCTNHLDPTSCFFPQNLVSDIKTPMFLLNTAYDSWQIQESLAPPTTDPGGIWKACKSDHSHCNSSQIQFFQEFRNQMVFAIKQFSTSDQNGLFINSCFAHCQSERQDTWFAQDSPQLNGKRVAESVGDWYFDRAKNVKNIDCPYPCDTTCHNLIFDFDQSALVISASSRFRFPLFRASLVPLVLTTLILRFLGFAISGKRILTCAHVVGVLNQCTFIDVQRNNSTTIYKARVTKITHECDLAILEVDNDDFWEGMSALSFADIPPLGEALTVVGFPEGRESHVCETGLVLGIKFQRYSHSQTEHLVIVVDANIISGHSGGPVITQGKVIGVAFQSIDFNVFQAHIGSVIPTCVVMQFFSSSEESQQLSSLSSLGLTFKDMSHNSP